MSFLDQLRALRTVPQAAWLEFIGRYRVGCFDLYLFFEGKDDFSFYQPYLRNIWRDRGVLHSFNCDGKQEVIQIITRVKPKLDYEWRGLFFVDKDVDDFCGHTRHVDRFLYETEYYSIESFITCEKTLEIIWTDFLSLPVADTRLNEVLATYATSSQSFYLAMKDVMAWVIHLRRAGHHVVLNNVNMSKVITLDADCKCALVADWLDHIHAASSIVGVGFDSVAHNTVVTQLSLCEPKTYIRGKFEMWYFVAFVTKMLEGVSSRMSGLPRAVCSVQISPATAIDVLAPRLQPPGSLQEFVRRVLPAGA